MDAMPVPAEPPALSSRRLLLAGLVLTASAVSLVLLLPQMADLPSMWDRVAAGDHAWLAGAFLLNLLSLGGYVVLFRAVAGRVGLRDSALIMLAGNAASRLFASAGAGGVVLTAWALRRSGMEREQVTARMTTFLVLMYAVYMAALVAGGLGLWLGVLPGDAPLGMTLVPAAFGLAVIVAALVLARVRGGALAEGLRGALRMLRGGLLGAVVYWGAQVGVLWACFHAFGEAPPAAVLVVAFFVGMLANTLPLPGGVGGVDGGMIGALVVFGVDAELSVLAVLAYRGFAFWLPIVPGVVAYFALRRVVAGWSAVDAAAADVGGEDLDAGELRRRAGHRVPVEHDDVRVEPRRQPAPALLVA
jgi:uncharacterized membrane protein YbhN (UPF0104 family)